MGFEEAEIKRKMSEIADWLKSQAEPPPPPPPAPKLHVVASAPVQDEESLDGIIQRRMAARRERVETEPESGSLREVMGRFSGPIHAETDPERRGALNAAVAEIMQRQRHLEEGEPDAHDADTANMEAAFERLAEQFERRAARTFDTLEASLAEVSGLVRDAQSPSEHVHSRIEELARELAELRADATDSERRTRELLDVVRQTLEHVAARLPERAAAPQPVEASPSIRARAAAMRAQQESGESEEFDLAAHATPERRQFIAAARRARAPEPAAKYRVQNAPRPASYPIEAARPSTMKRTLLAGAAAAALLFGIYAGSSRFLEGVFSDPEIASVPNEGAARTETAMASAPTPAETQGATTADAPAPVIAPPPPAPVEAASIPAEPATTGSIPQAAEQAAPDPLPVEIGGPRLRTRAVAGDANAQYEVAMRFAEGRGVARDMEKAAMWMTRAANQGLAPAQYRLGSLTEKGTGVTKNAQAARRLYEQAAGAGNVQAMHNLGVLHAEGGLGTPDMAVALVWFRKAADYGVKDSQYNLGIFYARGLSVPQDLSQSYFWFALAAAQGDKEAASKRDQIAAKLGADQVQAMKVKADTWKPKAAPIEANEVAPPPEGWDTPANQARAN